MPGESGPPDQAPDLLVVGRIGKAHGLRGEVSVDVRTDDLERRFAPGSVLLTEEHGTVTVEAARMHSGRLLVAFAGVPDRTAAEQLRGCVLRVDAATSVPSDDPDEFWDHELVGLSAHHVDGPLLGTVREVTHTAGGDLLVVVRPDGRELFVPFVRAIVPTVDRAAGRLTVAPPEGLLELGEPGA